MRVGIPSAKEIAIFEATLHLHYQGKPFHGLKVADIATEAGIGKGTVYEYFKSKEELIARAIAYQMGKEFEEIGKIIATAPSFRECTFEILEKIIGRGSTIPSPFFLIRPDILSKEEVATVFIELKRISEKKENEMIAAYLSLGVKEQLFPAIVSKEYCRQVVTAAMSGFHIMYHTEKNIPFQNIMENTYQLVVKALQ